MRGLASKRLAVGLAAVALLASACGGDDGGGQSEAPSGGEIRAQLAEPEHLVPTNANETQGGMVLRALYQGLVDYDANTSKPFNVIAESITASSDQKKFTIKIKKGWKFHNGEPVDAAAFARAWNFGALGDNAQGNSHFFERVEGYKALNPEDPDGEGPQKAPPATVKEMSGVKVVDESTMEVTLSRAFAGFPTMLGYTAFYPMAKACVEAIKDCEEAPIGNGPFKMDGKWVHEQEIKLVRNADYGGDKAQADRLTFKIYKDSNTAYNDLLAGNIDVMETTPPQKIPEARQRFGSQGRLIEKPTGTIQFINIPLYRPEFQNKLLRQAFSMAIDRQAIIDAVFQGRHQVLKDIAPPSILGGRSDANKYATLDVAKAKDLLKQAGGWPAGKKLELWFNAGANHDLWVQAVGNELKKNLGIDFVLKGQLQFAQYLDLGDKKGFTGPFRLGWSPDYPLMENYLAPILATGGSSNQTSYTNKQVDDLIAAGDSAPSVDEAVAKYQQAADLALEDCPILYMWNTRSSTIFTEKLSDVVNNPFQLIEWHNIKVKK